MRHLLELEGRNLDHDRWLLDRAATFCTEGAPSRAPFVVGSLFLASSLRTRLGFEAAALRLGGATIHHTDLRWDPTMAEAESFADTVRTMAGFVDLLVIRANVDLAAELADLEVTCPVICAGDRTTHPVQALVDLFAVEQLRGPVSEQRIAVVGDLGMRTFRSLLTLLGRIPPTELLLVPPPGRAVPGALPPILQERTRHGTIDEIVESDVIVMAGLPAGRGPSSLDARQRAAYSLTAPLLDRCLAHAVVLSPMPVIDEIAPDAMADSRVRVFEQSALSVSLRMAVIESMLGPASSE